MASSKKKKKKKKGSSSIYLLKYGTLFLIVLVASYIITNYIVRKSVVHNVSMQKTLYDGDKIIMDELSYYNGDPKRYDVICFKSYKEKELLIKRVIGLPGETVRISDGVIYINDKEIRDVSGVEAVGNAGLASSGILLDEDEYFVLGDNRPESIDSRFADVGNIKRKDIIGKAVLVYWPANRIKIIK